MDSDAKGLLIGFEIEELRAKIRRAPYDQLWARLARRTHDVMAAAREAGFGTLSYGSLAWYSITPMSMEAAMLWRLAEDEDALTYVEECIRCLDGACRDPAEQKRLSHGKPPVNSFNEMALATAICWDGLSAERQAQFKDLMRDVCIDYHQGAKPYTDYGGGGNVGLCQMINASVCALVWGEDCGHPDWRTVVDHGIMHTRCYLKRGLDPDGFGYEGTGYSYSVFHYLFLFVQLLWQHGYADLFAAEPVLRRVGDATFQLAFPDASSLININDLGLLSPASMAWLLYLAKHFDEPRYLGLWHAYQGPDHPRRPYGDVMPWFTETQMSSVTPIDEMAAMLQAVLNWDADAPVTPFEQAGQPTAFYAAGTETLCWRTSWGSDAVFANFLGTGRSHASYTHRHADCGHFSILAHGEYLAIDTGRYNADEDQHNVVMVDGKCHLPNVGWGMSHRAGRLAGVQTTELLTYARADMAHMKDCGWADRHFLAVPLGDDDCYFVSIDNLNKDNAYHSYHWQLHANPDCQFELTDETHAVLRGQQARLDLTFAIPRPEDYPQQPHSLALRQDIAEWSWPYGKEGTQPHKNTWLWATSFRRPRLIAEVAGLNGQIMAVMVPRRLDAPPLQVRVLPHPRLLRVEIEAEDFTDTIVAALDHGCIVLPEMRGLTEVALVRRDRQGQVLTTWTADGSPLELRG